MGRQEADLGRSFKYTYSFSFIMKKLVVIAIIALLILVSACSEQPTPKKSVAAKTTIEQPTTHPEIKTLQYY